MLLALLLPATAPGAAFEEHTSWQKEPVLETAKGISLGKAVMEMGTAFRYLHSDAFFNSAGKIQTIDDDEGWMQFDIMVLDLFARYGFTENWTLWFNIPIVWSSNDDPVRVRESEGLIGDCETGLLYQFFRENDPTLSMGVGLRWKLPTGQETPGAKDVNITGTGTTDVELFYAARWQILRYLNIGLSTGYNIRFPGAVQYISDQHTSITNAFLDLGDEIFLRGEATGAIDWGAVRLIAEFRYRLPTEVAMPEFIPEMIQWRNPRTGETEEETYLLYNGASYEKWGVHERLDPTKDVVSSAGYLFSLTPQIIVRPLDWIDVTLYTKLYLMGKNSIFLTDRDSNNQSFDNFMPMQSLGTSLGFAVLGELGGYATIRW